MAQEPETERNASGIARAAKRKWGYDAEQVDAFLERAHRLYEGEGAQLTQHDIQNVSFELVKGGYVIAQVDAALARLERAVVDKQTTWEISQHGRVAWKAQTEDLFKKLDAHAEREPGERFKPGEGKNPSYDRKQVDRVIDKCLTKAAGELGLEQISEEDSKAIADMNAQTISNVVFTQRKGKKGYDERQVDYYLAACGQLLTRLESYARVADFVGEPSEETQSNIAPASADGGAPMSTSLFATPASAAPAAGTAPSAPSAPAVTVAAAGDEKDSFDALNKAEHEIFTSAAPSPVSAPTAKVDTPTVPPVVPPVFHPQTTASPAKPKVSEETQVFDPLADDVPQASAPQASAPRTPAVQPVSSESGTGSDPSLAALAHLAHTVNAVNVTENTFTPQVPKLSMSETPKPVATPTPESLAASVPPSFAPEPAAPAVPAAPVAASATSAPTAPVAPSAPAPQPETSTSAAQADEPAAPAPEPPAQAKQKSDKPVQPLFPASIDSANLDIPDLSFPSFD